MLIVSFSFARTKIHALIESVFIFCCNPAIAHVQNERLQGSRLYGEHKLGVWTSLQSLTRTSVTLARVIGYKHVIGIFVGTGIGGAIIIDGKLYLGARGHAGNIGHYLLQPLGPLALKSHAVTTGAAKLAVDSL
jgi:ROK family